MKQIAKVTYYGRYIILYDEKAKYNPYKVYKVEGNSRKLLAKWTEVGDAMMHLAEIIKERGNVEVTTI